MLKDQENIEDFDDDEYEDIDETDFAFVVSADGSLKSLMIPENLMENPPKEIVKILKIFGIKDIHLLEPKTLH